MTYMEHGTLNLDFHHTLTRMYAVVQVDFSLVDNRAHTTSFEHAPQTSKFIYILSE